MAQRSTRLKAKKNNSQFVKWKDLDLSNLLGSDYTCSDSDYDVTQEVSGSESSSSSHSVAEQPSKKHCQDKSKGSYF